MTELAFAWTPPGSFSNIGTVVLRERPTGELDWTTYKFALADRIDRMIERLWDHEARALLSIVEERDRLTLPPAPPTPEGEEDVVRDVTFSGLGVLMVEKSSWLSERSGWAGPVPADQLQHDPDALLATVEESLEEYLGTLYYTGRD